jgi:hypothetical protein
MLAELAPTEEERQAHIAQARAILRAGAPIHNYMYFNNHMMTASLKRGEWEAALRHRRHGGRAVSLGRLPHRPGAHTHPPWPR